MALIVTEYLVVRTILRSRLNGDHFSTPRRQNLVVRRIHKFIIFLVAGTFSRILTTISAVAKRLSLSLSQVLSNVTVKYLIDLNIIPVVLFETTLVRHSSIN